MSEQPRRGKLVWQVTFTRAGLVNPDLCPSEKAIILALAAYANIDLQSMATKQQLMDATGLKDRRLKHYLDALHDRGYISRRPLHWKGKNRNEYTLLSPCNICLGKLARLPRQFLRGSLKERPVLNSVEPEKRPANVIPIAGHKLAAGNLRPFKPKEEKA